MRKEVITQTPGQTKELGEKLAKEILKKKPPKDIASVIGLTGELGGGKTTFLQGFAKGLGIKEKILSPTFVLMKKFPIKSLKQKPDEGSVFEFFYHIDCYRIKTTEEILGLGLKEIISCPKNIVAIEWAEKVKGILPKNTVIIKFDFLSEKNLKNKRELTITR